MENFRADGNPALIQSNLGRYPGNFELIVPVASGGLAHYSRSNNVQGLPWFDPNYFGSGQIKAVSIIQSSFGTYGNLEVLAIQDDNLVHYVRDDYFLYRWYGPLHLQAKPWL